MGGLSIYEIIFYGDSRKEMPLICKIKDGVECEKLKECKMYSNNIELEIVQKGDCDSFVKNTDKLLIIDKRTKGVLESLNIDSIQYVPTKINDMDYYIINVLSLISSSLDMEKSQYMIYPNDFPNARVRGRIGTIWKVVLLRNKICEHIFRIEEYRNAIFVDEYFKNIIEQYGFSGLDFQRVELS